MKRVRSFGRNAEDQFDELGEGSANADIRPEERAVDSVPSRFLTDAYLNKALKVLFVFETP